MSSNIGIIRRVAAVLQSTTASCSICGSGLIWPTAVFDCRSDSVLPRQELVAGALVRVALIEITLTIGSASRVSHEHSAPWTKIQFPCRVLGDEFRQFLLGPKAHEERMTRFNALLLPKT